MANKIKIDIFEDERYIGQLKIQDRWLGILPIDEEEIKDEIIQRLPTLRKAKFTIAFA